ncbi:MAG: hypothetical protein ACIARR_08795 [Phycisphaerales bacterium JB059]
MTQIIDIKAVRRLAPEDVRVGAYVVPMFQVTEFFTPCNRNEGEYTVRRLEMTATDEIRVLRVVGVFLPFVFVRDAIGDHSTLDMRLVRVAEVPRDLGRFVRKRLRADKRRAIVRDRS